MKKKEPKYVNVIAKVSPELKEKVEAAADAESRTISQEIRRTLERTYK